MKHPRSLAGMASDFPRGVDHLICRVSFESRSLSVAGALASTVRETIAFHSKDASVLAAANLEQLRRSISVSLRQLDISDPLSTADAMLELATEIFGRPDSVSVIDVTAFRREELLILIRMLAFLAEKRPIPPCTLAYVGAAGMAEGWLSRNTTECRSVIGFAGDMKLSRPTHMVVMLGFEVERAVSLIEAYEPSKITIGIGHEDESISPELHARNKEFLATISAVYGKTGQFKFSLRDPEKTMLELDSTILTDKDSNFVVAPLNNKLSTIGAGMLALRRRDIQICYASVAEYNEATYSSPREDVYLLELSAILERISYD